MEPSGETLREEIPRRTPDPAEPRPEGTCPNCGAALREQKRTLLSPKRECGHSMSCSDFC